MKLSADDLRQAVYEGCLTINGESQNWLQVYNRLTASEKNGEYYDVVLEDEEGGLWKTSYCKPSYWDNDGWDDANYAGADLVQIQPADQIEVEVLVFELDYRIAVYFNSFYVGLFKDYDWLDMLELIKGKTVSDVTYISAKEQLTSLKNAAHDELPKRMWVVDGKAQLTRPE